MKKRYIMSAVGAASVTAGYFLTNKENRGKIKDKARNVTNRVKSFRNSSNTTIEDAGMPDQSADKDIAQLENAKMVSEGSQFGVKYYNEKKQEDANIDQNR